MNDKRFIELLNLYVDQELTEDEARALEQEIAQRPERRRVYSQYCRMQRACVRLFEERAAPTPDIEGLATAAAAAGGSSEMIDFPVPADEPAPARRVAGWSRAVWGAGLAAAAACVAFVAVRQNELPASSAHLAGAALKDLPTNLPTSVVAATPAAVAVEQGDYQPVLVVNTLLRPGSEAEGGANGIAALDASSLGWLQEMKLLPMRRVPFETLRFDAQGRLEAVDHAAFAVDQVDPDSATEISAFQFQR